MRWQGGVMMTDKGTKACAQRGARSNERPSKGMDLGMCWQGVLIIIINKWLLSSGALHERNRGGQTKRDAFLGGMCT